MDTIRVCLYPLIFYIHLLTLLEEASVWWHRCLGVYFCVRMNYLYANESGRACWVLRVCLYVFEKKAGVTSAGEQMVEENLEDACWRVTFLLKSQQYRCGSCLNYVYPSSSSSLLFPLYSDEILLFKHTVWMPVWLEVLWHKTHLLYLTEMPNAAVSDDRQAHTPFSATCFSSSLSNGRAPLAAPCQNNGTQWAEWQSV